MQINLAQRKSLTILLKVNIIIWIGKNQQLKRNSIKSFDSRMNSKYSHCVEIKHSTVFMYLTTNTALEILGNAEELELICIQLEENKENAVPQKRQRKKSRLEVGSLESKLLVGYAKPRFFERNGCYSRFLYSFGMCGKCQANKML